MKENREATYFTGIALSGSIDVEMDYGKGNALAVEADENLLPYPKTTVKDGILLVKAKGNAHLKSSGKITVHGSAFKLTDLELSGIGNINGTGDLSNEGTTRIALSGSGNINVGLKYFQETRINLSGRSNITVSGSNINQLITNISGSGCINCSEMPADNVDASVSGSGNVKVNANKNVNAKLIGSGSFYYKGAATNITTKAFGSGKMRRIDD